MDLMLWRETPTASASCCCVQLWALRSSLIRLMIVSGMSSWLSIKNMLIAYVCQADLSHQPRTLRRRRHADCILLIGWSPAAPVGWRAALRSVAGVRASDALCSYLH